MEQRRADLPTSEGNSGDTWQISASFLQEGPFPERKALIRNFVKRIEIVDDRGRTDVHHPHAIGRGDVGIGLGS